jgi:hypothetical protein
MRSNLLTAIVLVTVLLVATVERQQAVTQVWYLQGAAAAAGQFGAQFSSTLTVTNVSASSTSIQIGFIPYAGKSTPPAVSRALAAGETLQIPRALETLFGLTGDAGTLTVASEAALIVWLATENIANPSGTYGLALQPLTSNTLLPAGAVANSIWVSQGGGYRTNVAFTLLDPNSSIRLSVYDEQNRPRGSTTISSVPPISWQAPISDLIGPDPLLLGRVEYQVIQGRAAAYAAVVDNVTNDGIAAIAEIVRSDANDFLLNGVARTAGANGAYWRSDIRLFNPNSDPLTVTIDGLGFTGGGSSITRTVPALGLAEITDVLGPRGLDYPQGSAGALHLHAAAPFLVAGRTSNLDPTGTRPGSFSAFERAVSHSSGFYYAPASATFTGISQSSGAVGFRTNLAFLARENGAVGNLILRDRLGLQDAIAAFSLTSGEWTQKNVSNWFPGVTISNEAQVEVRLTAGSLNGYASRIDNGTGDAVVLPLEPISSTADTSESPQIAGCPVFPLDNPWNRDISKDPLHPNSANYMAHMNGNSKSLHPDFGSDPTYGIPYVVVPGSQPKVPMTFDYDMDSDPGPYPFPSNAPIEGGSNSTGDRHVLVLDKDNCLLYETWDSHFLGPGWHCGSGAIFNLKSNQLRPDTWTSADAAGLPILPGLVRYDEAVTAGEIRHALRFTVQSTQRAFIHPATHYASSNTDPNAPPMGLRVRLKSNYDLTRFHGTALVIMTALKKYGLIVADNGSDWYITGATDSRWDDDDLNQLKTVPANVFEVVQSGPIIK